MLATGFPVRFSNCGVSIEDLLSAVINRGGAADANYTCFLNHPFENQSQFCKTPNDLNVQVNATQGRLPQLRALRATAMPIYRFLMLIRSPSFTRPGST
jgi:hypothetical protein